VQVGKLAVSHRDTEAAEAEEKKERVGFHPVRTPSFSSDLFLLCASVWNR
jgi:transposase